MRKFTMTFELATPDYDDVDVELILQDFEDGTLFEYAENVKLVEEK